MLKTFVVAKRDYLAAVRSKAFIIGLILMPVMMSGGIIAQRLGEKIGDTSTKKVALIDRTPGQTLYDALAAAVEKRNTSGIFDRQTGRQVRARFVLEKVAPASVADPGAVGRQRLELSDRVRSGELLAFVEIGHDVLKPRINPTAGTLSAATQLAEDASQMSIDELMAASEKILGENNLIRYSTNRPTYRDFLTILQTSLPQVVFQKRMLAAGVEFLKVMPLLTPPQVVQRGLSQMENGQIVEESKQGQLASYLVPLALIMLMFVVVLTGASPMTANVIEEKQLRIAEVMLGSVRPFEMMMGKLLGGVGVALTLAAIYFGGAYYVARQQGMATYITPGLVGWFLFFTVIATLMYGSMFVAAGAAVTNIKEAQAMITPVMLFVVLPLFIIGNLIQDPSGPVATAASFFPFSAPLVTTARIAIPPGIPVWQALLAAAISLLTTLALVWAAGRIFRVGILMQGQAAKIPELMRWIVRG